MEVNIFRRLSQHAGALAGARNTRIVQFEGKLVDDLGPLTAIYAGNGDNFEYLQRLLFSDVHSQTSLAETHPLRLHRYLSKLETRADLLLCERPPLWALLGAPLGNIRFPAWLRQELELPRELPMTKRLLPRQVERETDRYIRRHGYTLSFSRSETDLADFYRDLYSPYVASRFGAEGLIVPWSRFIEEARSLTLAKLHSEGRWIAGMLLATRGRTLRLGWFGASTEPPAPGASQVLDVMCIRHAWLNGTRRVVFGNSRPSLADGIVRYKRKFGARLVATRFPQAVLEIGILRPSPAVAAVLERRQLVVHDGAGFTTHPQSASP